MDGEPALRVRVTFLRRETSRAPARGPTPHPPHPRPYNDKEGMGLTRVGFC
jgi:hypothetical protein